MEGENQCKKKAALLSYPNSKQKQTNSIQIRGSIKRTCHMKTGKKPRKMKITKGQQK